MLFREPQPIAVAGRAGVFLSSSCGVALTCDVGAMTVKIVGVRQVPVEVVTSDVVN